MVLMVLMVSLVEIEANLLIGESVNRDLLDRITALGGSKSVGVARGAEADVDDERVDRPAVMVLMVLLLLLLLLLPSKVRFFLVALTVRVSN